MRGLVVALVLAACGGDTGLLLDIDPGTDSGVTTVEVFVAKDQTATRMGLPPAASTKATQGDAYAVIDHTSVDIAVGGRARVLIERGTLTQIPALLVLGYDANHTPVRYAIVTDPSGAIALPATKEVRLVVDLDPASGTTIASARTAAGNPGMRIARWSAMTRGNDDPAGPCVAVLHDATTAGVAGTFFGPEGDVDCDQAQPECDDAWFLRVKDPGRCGTTVPPANDDTSNACRVGNTAGCKDNQPNASNTCTADATAICLPSQVCEQCAADLDPSCVQQQLTDPNTAHILCTLYVRSENAGPLTMCGSRGTTLAMSAVFGGGYACTGTTGFSNLMSPTVTAGMQLQLASSPDAKLTFSCHAQTTDFGFDVIDPTTAPIDPALMDTQGAALFTVAVPGGTASTRLLVLPITVHYVDVSAQMCPTSGMSCELVPDPGAGAIDTLWHCAGS